MMLLQQPCAATAGHLYHLKRESDDKILYRTNDRAMAEKKQAWFKCPTFIQTNISFTQAINEHIAFYGQNKF